MLYIDLKLHIAAEDLPVLQAALDEISRRETTRWQETDARPIHAGVPLIDTPTPALAGVPDAAPDAAPEVAPEVAPEEVPIPTDEAVSAMLTQLVTKLGVPGVRDFLRQEFAVARVSELSPVQKARFVDRATTLVSL